MKNGVGGVPTLWRLGHDNKDGPAGGSGDDLPVAAATIDADHLLSVSSLPGSAMSTAHPTLAAAVGQIPRAAGGVERHLARVPRPFLVGLALGPREERGDALAGMRYGLPHAAVALQLSLTWGKTRTNRRADQVTIYLSRQPPLTPTT